MNKRKIFMLAMAVMMIAILAVGGSLAYFMDTDNKTNTFTIGNVDIHIDEWMEDENGEWVPYEDQELHPIDASKLTNNKLVETVNDGTEDAYIRTFITCPMDMYDFLGLGFNSGANAVVGTNAAGENMYPVTWKDVGTFTINGEDTAVFLCEVAQNDSMIVKAGESVLSLTTVWLYDSVTNADVEKWALEMEEGENPIHGAFKVEVASQAIQSTNLTYEEAMAELGEINQDLMDKLFNN